jgi:hypothetical protein
MDIEAFTGLSLRLPYHGLGTFRFHRGDPAKVAGLAGNIDMRVVYLLLVVVRIVAITAITGPL